MITMLSCDSIKEGLLVTNMSNVFDLLVGSRGNQHPSLLDLVFTSHPEALESITHLAPLGYSDHDLLLWNYMCYYQPVLQNTTNQSWNYSKGDYDAFNNYFQQLDWFKLFNDGVEHNWSVLKEHISMGQELFIHKKN